GVDPPGTAKTAGVPSSDAWSPPTEMICVRGSTRGDGLGFRLHPWRRSCNSAAAGPSWLAAVFGTHGRAISPPMAMTCHLGSTYGDDSGFRRHLWPSFSSCIAEAAQTSLAAVFGTRGTVISPPMAMTCHLASTYGDDSGFRRHLRRRFSSCVAEAAETSLAAVFGTRGTGASPALRMTRHLPPAACEASGLRPPLCSSFSSCIAEAAQTSLAAVFGTRGTVISPPMAMTCHLGSTYGDDSGFRRHPRRRFPNVVGKKTICRRFGGSDGRRHPRRR